MSQNQSKFWSFIECTTNTLIGLVLAFFTQRVMFNLTGIEATITQNFQLLAGFTVVSLVRSYIIRRFFNSNFLEKFREVIKDYKELLNG